MKKILLVGNCPLPSENTKSRPAAGLRTWQFLEPLKALARTGEIRLVSALIAMPECYGGASAGRASEGAEGKSHEDGTVTKGLRAGPWDAERSEASNYKEYVVDKSDAQMQSFIQGLCNENDFDVIVAVNTFPSYIASGLKCGAPLWCDLNGWIMAEAQAQAYKTATNDYFPHYFEMEKRVILRGDKFSAVSEPQSFAIYGELAAFGRSGRESFGYKFVEHVPNGTEDFEGERSRAESEALLHSKVLVSDSERGRGELSEPSRAVIKDLPAHAFALLWLGGYNTWADEHTLFKGLELAMNKCEKLYFVSTGGAVQGLEDKTFARFKEMIDGSKHKDRFTFLGWVKTKDIPSIYGRADAGLNVDRKCLETSTGARNRINEMMKFGLPVITTEGSEISGEVAKYETGTVAESGNHEDLGRAIIEMYEEWRGGGEHASEKFKNYGKNGRKYILEKCNYEVTTAPLFDWLKNPLMAPDRGLRVEGGKIKMALRYLRERGLLQFLKKLWQRI